MRIIDLFSGVGGFSLGAKMSSAKNIVLAANEIDLEIANSYKKNHKKTKMIVGDIQETKNAIKKYKNIDVIIGGPPCQGFSVAGARNRKNFVDDPRNYLFRDYIDVVEGIKPKYLIMENVVGIVSSSKGLILKEIIQKLRNLNYDVSYKIISADDYGVPQKRKRFILFGCLKGDSSKFFKIMTEKYKVSKKTTLRQAIYDLLDSKYVSDYLRIVKDGGKITNNIGTNHSSRAKKLMSLLQQGENKDKLLKLGYKIKSVHSGAYGRATWDEPAKTLITRFDTPSSGMYTHPVLNRTFTPREGARIQSFPDSFEFLGSKTSVYKQIGNAVPPLLGKALFSALNEFDNEKRKMTHHKTKN